MLSDTETPYRLCFWSQRSKNNVEFLRTMRCNINGRHRLTSQRPNLLSPTPTDNSYLFLTVDSRASQQDFHNQANFSLRCDWIPHKLHHDTPFIHALANHYPLNNL